MDQIVDALLGRDVVSPSIISSDIVALNLAISFALSLLVALTYKKVHKGVSYSQSYVVSIVLVSMVVALAMMVIGNDITRAFALLGTFTIIRYRTAVKDPKDTAFIFIALVIGLAVGSSNYGIAVTGTVIMCIAALLLHFTNFAAAVKTEQVLYLTADIKEVDSEEIETHMRSHFKSSSLLNVNYIKDGDQIMYSYNVQSKKPAEEFVSTIAEVAGVTNAEVLSSQNLIEF